MLALLSVLLTASQLATALPQQVATSATASYPLPTAPLPGLPNNGIRVNDVAIGVLPDWSHESPRDVNAALGASVSIIGDYLNVSPGNGFSMNQVSYHLPEILRIARSSGEGNRPVYAPALLYGSTLDTWTSQATQNVADAMANINKQGITVYLRLNFEMNGDWMPYGLDPTGFIRVWREVTTAVRAKTNETYMLWAPNVFNGDVNSNQGYATYWPGEDYVDIAGLSFYSLGYRKSQNQPPDSSLFRDSFAPFASLLNPSSASANTLRLSRSPPLVISETSAPFYYHLPPSSPYYSQAGDTDIAGPLPNLTQQAYEPSEMSPPAARADDELFMKASWFVQLTSNATAQRFPRLKAVSLFNYLKRGGDDGANEVLVDFRATGGNQTVENWYRGYMGNQTAFEMGYTGGARSMAVGSCMVFTVLSVAASAWL